MHPYFISFKKLKKENITLKRLTFKQRSKSIPSIHWNQNDLIILIDYTFKHDSGPYLKGHTVRNGHGNFDLSRKFSKNRML
jgi:hypothetical protein